MQTQFTVDRESREALHRQVEALAHTNWRVRAILHAMIDAGSLVRMECQLPNCVMADRSFDMQKRGRGHNAKGLVIDHIVPQLQGGSDRPENLRIVHATCNVTRAAGWKQTPEVRARISQAAKERGGWRMAVEKRERGWNRKIPDDVVREMRRLHFAEGVRIADIAERFGVGYSTARAAIKGLWCYAEVV